MSFCTRCGRARSGDARFCTGCGATFPDDAGATSLAMQPGTMPSAETPPAETPLAQAPPPIAATTVEPAAAVAPPSWPSPAPSETRAEGFWTAVGTEPPSSQQPETRWDTAFHQNPAPEAERGYSPFPTTPPPVEPAPPTPSLPPPAYGYTPSQPAPTYGYTPSQQAPTYGITPPSQPTYGLTPSQPAEPTYGPPGQSPPVWSPTPAPPGETPPSGSGRRGRGAIVIAVVVAVLLAGGGAFAAVTLLAGKHNHPVSQPSNTPTVHRPSPTPSTSPTQSASPTPSPTTSPSPTASPSVSPTVSPTPTGVAAGPGVTGNSAEPGVLAFLNSYFTAINAHDYTAYNALLDTQLQQNDTESSFNNGYATTKDSAETLTSIADTGDGGEAATVSFTSHQSIAQSASNSTCTNWTITLYLEPNGTGYLESPAPSGYHASFSAC
jgi:hypothetical protein